MQELRLPIRSCLTDGDGSRTVEVPATNRRGKQIQSRVTITPLRSTLHARPGIQGVILVME